MSLDGTAAPPMANGEIVFEAPWQSRTFGLSRALCEQGHYTWDEFRERLIATISEAGEADFSYFDCFQLALTRLLVDKHLLGSEELGQRESTLAARPHGHDH